MTKPPKPEAGWSWVVHPVGGASKALRRQQLQHTAAQQWLADDEGGQPGSWGPVSGQGAAAVPADPTKGPEPASAYVAQPDGSFRGLNEEEALIVGDRMPKPRRRWYSAVRKRR
jgi:hypothetical protein